MLERSIQDIINHLDHDLQINVFTNTKTYQEHVSLGNRHKAYCAFDARRVRRARRRGGPLPGGDHLQAKDFARSKTLASKLFDALLNRERIEFCS